MKPLIILTFLFACFNAFAQQQTFDITTFTAPAGWEQKPSEAGIQFIKEDTTTGAYCVITLFKSTPATTNAKENFELTWTSLVKDMIEATEKPIMGVSAAEDGWEVLTGHINFEREGIKGVALLVNSSGYEKMVNVVILTNSDVFEKNISGFLESITLKKPEPVENNNASVIGTWGTSSVMASFYNMTTNEGSIITQYTFNPDGTYSFYVKTFQYQMEHLLFTRETGKYQISGNNITIEPQKSIIESWTKKEGTDNWGKLIKSQKRELEKMTYQFDIQQFVTGKNLVLRAGKLTKRDGNYNNHEKDAWLYAFKPEIEHIKLPGVENVVTTNAEVKPAIADGYQFNTSNFDDGWTSTVQEDWVQVTKANIQVLIHYPNKQADAYQTDLLESTKNAWNVLVAPRYSSIGPVEFKPVHSWESIEWAEADATDNATGKQVHIILFKKNYSGGGGKYIEFIVPDKNSFVHEFGSDYDKLASMANYNKFAVAATDLKGKWTSNFSGATQYVNIYTGLSAGMDTYSSNVNYDFGPGSTYHWDISVASGMVGNIKFQGAKSNGKFSMLNNWQISFSDIEGKPRTSEICFTCVKGARLLWVDGTAFYKKE